MYFPHRHKVAAFWSMPASGRFQPVTWNLNERLLYANADIQTGGFPGNHFNFRK
jgi:hypothetical protein